MDTIIGDGGETYHDFGESISVSGSLAVVGSRFADGLSPLSGAVYVFDRGPDGWVQSAKLFSSNGAVVGFGVSVSLVDDRLLVGALSEAAYIFERQGTTWIETAELLPSDGVLGHGFGRSVSLSGDRALIGAWKADGVAEDTGAAYVFDRGPAGWVQTAKLFADDGAGGIISAGDLFGLAVSLSGDVALVGAYKDDDACPFDPDCDSGSAYVFELGTGGWVQTTKLVPGDSSSVDSFGFSVLAEGDLAFVGGKNANGIIPGSGAVYRFERTPAGWLEKGKIFASDGAGGDDFGRSISKSGSRLLVGATGSDKPPLIFGSGSAYIFEETPAGWVEQTKLTADDPEPADKLGWSVSLSGYDALIGAINADGAAKDGGAVYIVSPQSPATLDVDTASISLAIGGTQVFDLSTCPLYHAHRAYLLLGTAGTTTPGLQVDGVLLPLTVDGYFLHALANPNTPPLAGFFGQLDAAGRATASIALSPGQFPGLAGLTLSHAYLVIAVPGPGHAVLASQAAALALLP